MPSTISDIHEIAVMIGLAEDFDCNQGPSEKFAKFHKYATKYGRGKISISKQNMSNKEENVFNRGVLLAKKLKHQCGLQAIDLTWSGTDNHREDSSDIYSDGIGISLKDSSKIIRNSGFSQLIRTFCKNTIKKFKDPFWEFAPSLSVEYLRVVAKDCYERKFLELKNNHIYIDGVKKNRFDDNINTLLALELNHFSLIIKKTDIKLLVKDFSSNGCSENLFEIRKRLVSDVSSKVLSIIREGLMQNPSHFSDQIKYMLQYRNSEKLFGFSSKKLIYAGKIKKRDDVKIDPIKVFTEASKLSKKKTGLQINIYTKIEINFSLKKEQLTLQNQLRYKHRTFSSAPEANFHLMSDCDWKKIYPLE